MIRWDAYPAAPAAPLYAGQPEADDYDPGDAPPGRVGRLAFDSTGAVLVTMPHYPGVMRPLLPPATVWRPDGTRLFDLPTLPLMADPSAVAVGPGGAWVAVGVADFDGQGPLGSVRVWDTVAGRMLAVREVASAPDDLRPLPDGGLLMASAGSVFLFHPRGGRRRQLAGCPDAVRVAVGDGWLAAAGKTGAAVWTAAGKRVASREHKKGPQNGPVAFRPHTTELAVGHGTVVDLWDWQAGTERTLKGHKRPVWAVGFSPDGGTAYTAASDGAVIAWDADTGAIRERFDFGTGKIYSAAVSPDGLTLALGGDDGRVTVVDLS